MTSAEAYKVSVAGVIVVNEQGGSESESEEWCRWVCLVLLLGSGGDAVLDDGRDDSGESAACAWGIRA